MRFLLITLGTLYCLHANSQDSTLAIKLSVTLAGSTESTPFWMHANKSGATPINKYYTSGDWGIYKTYNPNNPRKLQWAGGVEVITNYSYNQKSNVFFSDLYLAAKLGIIEFSAGQKKQIVSLTDSILGMGALAVSGNARPFPRVQITVDQFQPLEFTNNIVSLKGSLSEGILGTSNINYGSTRQIPQTYFHQKQLYFRVGEYHSPVQAYIGMNHQVIWGGEDKIWKLDKPGMLESYLHVVSGKSLNHKKLGNHFGSADLALSVNLDDLKIFVYRNSVFETGSVFKVINLGDGLNGVKITNLGKTARQQKGIYFHAINFEYLSLLNQKNQFQPTGQVIYEIADYYNNYVYQRGWSYYGFGLGSPMAAASKITDKSLPENSGQFTNNNRVQAFHTAIEGFFFGTKIIVKGTYSQNYGTYLTPFEEKVSQWSLLLSGEKRVKVLNGVFVSAGLASDLGKLYPKSHGAFVSIRKSAFLN